jgi:hypothetical protein
MAVTKDKIADLIVLLGGYGGQTKATLLNGVVGLSDEDAANLAGNIGAILSPSDVFNSEAIADFALVDADIYNVDEALAYAATFTPVEIFGDETGLAALAAWAVGDGYTKV